MYPLLAAFDLSDGPACIAIVGGGGKTSLLFALAKSLPGRVITTTTTRIFAAQMALSPAVIALEKPDSPDWARLAAEMQLAFDAHGQCLLVGPVVGQKAHGVGPDLPGQLLDRGLTDFVVVEADGSRMRPIKAPAEHEPVIPPQATLVVPVVGIDALNGRFPDFVHRPEKLLTLLNHPAHLQQPDARLQTADVAALLQHPQGGLKGVPAQAQVIPLLNKVETEADLTAARHIAAHILAGRRSPISRVVMGAMQNNPPIREVHTPVTAVILAAGQARRMGQTKQLLPWGETTVLGQTIRHAWQSRAHHVVVVTGHASEQVSAIAREAGAATCFNPDFATGEMLSSLQTAVRELPESVTAVLVMLADQPMVPAAILDQLLVAYWEGKGELIAPVHDGQRGNPVLISRTFFAELLALPVGAAPRTLLKKYPQRLHLVAVDSAAILQDLDTIAAYEQHLAQLRHDK